MSQFDAPTSPITGGALVGGAAIAGALAAGIANYRAACEANWDRFEAEQLQDLLRWSELMRAQDQIRMGREIQRLRDELERFRRDTVVSAARKLPR